LIGFALNEDDYICVKNLPGDIIAITDTTGITLVKYIYDAYGNFVVDVLRDIVIWQKQIRILTEAIAMIGKSGCIT